MRYWGVDKLQRGVQVWTSAAMGSWSLSCG